MAFFALQPAPLPYGHPLVAGLLCVGVLLLISSAVVRRLRMPAHLRAMTKSLPMILLVHGFFAMMFGVARAEGVPFLGAEPLAVAWAALLVLTLVLQAVLLRRCYYVVLPTARPKDPRDAYLPGRRRP